MRKSKKFAAFIAAALVFAIAVPLFAACTPRTDGGEHSQKNICDDWHIPKTTVNTVANKMRADGYIEFTKTDGREKLMKLTPKGTEYAERALTVIHSAENYAIKRTLERYSAAFVDAMEAFTAFFMEFDDGYDG